MSSFSLSWAIGVGDGRRGGSEKNITWSNIERKLLEAKEFGGTVTIDLMNAPEIGPQSLQMQTQNDCFLLSLGEDEGEDYIVRTFTNMKAEEGYIEILGNLWDSKLLCYYFEIVIDVFKEFFDTGNVSRRLLD